MTKILRGIGIAVVVVLLITFPRTMAPGKQSYIQNPPTHVTLFHWSTYLRNFLFLWHRLSTFSWGTSTYNAKPILLNVVDDLGPTTQLLGVAVAVTFLIGIVKGIYEGNHLGETTVGITVSGLLHATIEAIPDLFLLLSLELFGFYLERHGIKIYFVGSHQFFSGTFIPAVVLALVPSMYVSRVVRAVVAEQYNQQYLVTAAAKGLRRNRILFRHLAPNVVPAVLKSLVPVIAMLFSNLVLIEYLFYRQGVVSGLLNAMDYYYFIPASDNAPLPFNFGNSLGINEDYAYDPMSVFAYLVSCFVMIALLVLLIRSISRLIGYKAAVVNPYSDALRGEKSRSMSRYKLFAGGTILSLMVVLGLVYPWLPLPTPDEHFVMTFTGQVATPPFPPSPGHLLGTDDFGRDLLSRSLQGIIPTYCYVGVTSLIVVIVSALLAWGARRFSPVRGLIDFWNDLFTVLPPIIAALLFLDIPAVYFISGTRNFASFQHQMVFLSVLFVIEVGRASLAMYHKTSDLMSKAYMEAAATMGHSRWTLFQWHIRKPFVGFLTEQWVVEFGRILIMMVVLGFFGFALTMKWVSDGYHLMLDSTTHDWGALIAENSRDYLGASWVFYAPVLLVTVTMIGLNMLANGVREFLNSTPMEQSHGIRPEP